MKKLITRIYWLIFAAAIVAVVYFGDKAEKKKRIEDQELQDQRIMKSYSRLSSGQEIKGAYERNEIRKKK